MFQFKPLKKIFFDQLGGQNRDMVNLAPHLQYYKLVFYSNTIRVNAEVDHVRNIPLNIYIERHKTSIKMDPLFFKIEVFKVKNARVKSSSLELLYIE